MRLLLALLSLAAVTAHAQSTPTIRRTNPPTLPPTTGYSHVVESTGGRTIYISGQVALDATGALVGGTDVRAQTEQVFANLERALAAAGATFADVVKMTSYMTNAANVAVLREVRLKYLRPDQLPASTFVAVAGLARPEWLVEVEVIAVVAR
jgi:enamine deaminase RidA (YjgF/YER057c/UK114 family)